TAADEKFLKENGVTPDAAGLVKFFKERTLSDKDRANLFNLVRQLGDEKYRVRQQAMRKLIAAGSIAKPILTQALKNPDLEIHDRVTKCLQKIEKGPGPALPAAAARLLVQKKPQGAVKILVDYLPYADDEWLEEEVLTCVGDLALKDGKVD